MNSEALQGSQDDWQLGQILGSDDTIRGYFRKLAVVPDLRHEWRAWVTLHFRAQANLMPTSEDMDVFGQFETRVIDELETSGIAVLVAMVTLDGKRDYLLYFSDEGAFLKALRGLMDGLARFRPEVEAGHDPNWEQ